VTALGPVLGYGVCTQIAKEALATNRKVIDIIRREKLLDDDQVACLLRPENMTQPRRL